MKILFFFFILFAATAAKAQNDEIELKSGKKIETKITSHTTKSVVTTTGTYKLKQIKRITFFTKNYDDLEFYKQLEKAGVEYKFATVPH